MSEFKWRKGSRSGGQGNCVEIADIDGGSVAVRNSNSPGAGTLSFTGPEWDAFIRSVRDGELDRRS